MSGKARVLVFGGAFDPIHKGHLEVLGYALDSTRMFHQGWILPCYKSLTEKKMEEPRHRIAMIEFAIYEYTGMPGILCNCFEVNNKLKEGTLDILNRMKKEYDNCDFYFLIGMDQALSIHTWIDSNILVSSEKFVVVERASSKRVSGRNSDLWFMHPPHLYVGMPIISNPNVSSTLVRKELKETGNSENLFPSVLDYIKKERLYGT